MNHVPIHLLNSFVVFNGSLNITEAAEKLEITQPALSKQLIQLESYFAQSLFVTTGRKKSLTRFGHLLNQKLVDRIGNIQEVVSEAVQLHSRPELTSVRIAARRGVLDRLSALADFKGSIYFRELSNEETIQTLLDLKIDIGIVHRAPNSFELVLKPLFKEQFQIVIPKKMMTKKMEFSSTLLKNLQSKTVLGYGPQDKILEEIFASVEVDPSKLRIFRSTENYQSLSEMVNRGLGWCILPTYIQIHDSKCWTIRIPETVFASKLFYLCYRSQLVEAKWFKDLLAEIHQCFS